MNNLSGSNGDRHESDARDGVDRVEKQEEDLDADDDRDVPGEGADPTAGDVELPDGLHEGIDSHHGDDPEEFGFEGVVLGAEDDEDCLGEAGGEEEEEC